MSLTCLRALTRKKNNDPNEKSKFAQILTLFDLTMLGVGTTMGLEAFLIAGSVAKTEAGPGVCISILVAAFASAISGCCYAEFAARVPKAGSAYTYSYITVGEFAAYVIGWNLILEYGLGAASTSKGFSNYLDSLMDKVMERTLSEMFPIRASFLSTYPDILSLMLVLVVNAFLAFGIQKSIRLNNIFTLINIATIVVVIICGFTKADIKNWTIPKEVVLDRPDAGVGGFLPFGISGVMSGAAQCFYGFVGFDAIASIGEEAKRPEKDIPLAILWSLLIILISYLGICVTLTLMLPYYEQNSDAPITHAFKMAGWPAVMWIVTIGAIFGLWTSLLGNILPLPRVIYAMADDGLLFKFLSKVNPNTKTPVQATLVAGVLTGIIGMIFSFHQLIEMMSIGTLMAYTIVAICVLLLRYEPQEDNPNIGSAESQKFQIIYWKSDFLTLAFNLNYAKTADYKTSIIAKWAILSFGVFLTVVSFIRGLLFMYPEY